MNKNVPSYDAGRLSGLIGAIYDCAIDPNRWDAALDDLRDLLDCANGVLYVAGIPGQEHRLEKMVGIEPYWADKLGNHVPDVAELHSVVADFYTRPLNEPFVCSRDIPEKVWRANGYYREWARPQGIVDVIDTILMRRPDRVASCALGRHGDAGMISDREIVLTRLIAPHLRRAVTISDVIDMKTIEAGALGATLDALAAGVALVAEDGAVLHANRSAEQMFACRSPLRVVSGRLQARETSVTDRLMRAIAAALRDDSDDDAGLGIALSHAAPVSVAHVLPLANGAARSRLAPHAVAAVFVASETMSSSRTTLYPIAEAFSLTPAETRLLDRIARGDSLDEAAVLLRVAKTTARTHMARILAKTGKRRQAELMALIHRLAPDLQSERI